MAMARNNLVEARNLILTNDFVRGYGAPSP